MPVFTRKKKNQTFVFCKITTVKRKEKKHVRSCTMQSEGNIYCLHKVVSNCRAAKSSTSRIRAVQGCSDLIFETRRRHSVNCVNCLQDLPILLGYKLADQPFIHVFFYCFFFLSLLCLMYSAYWVLSHRETNIHTHCHTEEQSRVAERPCKQGFRMCEGATVPGENPHKYRENRQTPHIKN